jgi:hypothetical protein
MANATKALGSIALGSLIIAVIQFIRFILEYVDRKTKELQGGSAALKYLISCLKCCAWCLEKIMKFINRNAYIIVGVKGGVMALLHGTLAAESHSAPALPLPILPHLPSTTSN